jgi:hypothetical protein
VDNRVSKDGAGKSTSGTEPKATQKRLAKNMEIIIFVSLTKIIINIFIIIESISTEDENFI